MTEFPSGFERLMRNLRGAADTQSEDDLFNCIQRVSFAVDEKACAPGHSARVTHYSVRTAIEMGVPKDEIRSIGMAAQLHDIGKIAIDDSILTKTSALSAPEFEIIKRHTIVGANLLRPIPMLRCTLPGVEYHHERLDGCGYPFGLKEGQIPLQTRIITVADTFDAMTTDRPYQTAMNANSALGFIHSLRGVRFDVEVVDALIRIFGRGDACAVASHC